MSLRGPVLTLTSRREAPSCDRTGGDSRDGTDGQQKCPSIFFMLCEHLEHVYILKYILKNCHQHSYGFQILMSSWGCGSNFKFKAGRHCKILKLDYPYEVSLCTLSTEAGAITWNTIGNNDTLFLL